MAETFQAGDVVQLKSGGPVMTVRWAEEDLGSMTVYCDWFEKTKQMGAKFMPAQLQRIDPNPRV